MGIERLKGGVKREGLFFRQDLEEQDRAVLKLDRGGAAGGEFEFRAELLIHGSEPIGGGIKRGHPVFIVWVGIGGKGIREGSHAKEGSRNQEEEGCIVPAKCVSMRSHILKHAKHAKKGEKNKIGC